MNGVQLASPDVLGLPSLSPEVVMHLAVPHRDADVRGGEVSECE
jgi:hypothetical protein